MSGRRRLRGAAEVVLERRYRRLLAWYPAGYRAANQDEMLAVALAGAELGQRWPGVGEAASLVGGGLRLRARGLIGVLRTDPWGDVLALAGLAGAVLLGTGYTEAAFGHLASGWTGTPEGIPLSLIVLTVGWSLVAGAAILGWRWAAALGAALGAAGEAGHLAWLYRFAPASAADWWQLGLAVFTALATVSLLARPRTGWLAVRWPGLAVMLATAAALAVFPLVEASSTTVVRSPDGAATGSNPLSMAEGLVQAGLVAVLSVTLLVVMARPVWRARRRRKVPPAA